MNKKNVLLLLIIFTVVTFTGCAGPNTTVNTPGADGAIAGFWWGLWNGCTAPITFIASFFNHSIHFYEVHNNGGWYDFGFLLGIGALGKSTTATTKKRLSSRH